MAAYGKFTVINASRVHTGGLTELSTSGKRQDRCLFFRNAKVFGAGCVQRRRSQCCASCTLRRVVGRCRSWPGDATRCHARARMARDRRPCRHQLFRPFQSGTPIYMLPVVVAATQWGLGPGIVAAVAGAAAADFFFYPPRYTFWIRDPQNVVDLVLFLLIAVVTSNLAARLKNEAVALQRREKEITELHAFSQGLATCLTSRDLIFAVQDYLSNTLRYQAVLIATDQEMHAHASIPEDVRSGQAHCEPRVGGIDADRSVQRPRLARAHHQSGDSRSWRHRRRSRQQPGRIHPRDGAAGRNIAGGSDASKSSISRPRKRSSRRRSIIKPKSCATR